MDSCDLPHVTKYFTTFVDNSNLFKFGYIFLPQKTVPNFLSNCEMFELLMCACNALSSIILVAFT